jgi:hypothetical protein
MISRRKFFLFLSVTALIFITLIYYQIGIFLPHNSDDASLLLEAKSILGGNLFLNHWQVAPDNFWTLDLPYYVFFSILYPLNPLLMSLVPSFLYSALLLTAGLSTFCQLKNQSFPVKAVGLLITLVLLGALPPITASFFADLVLIGPVHICTIWYVILILFLRIRYTQPPDSSLISLQEFFRHFRNSFMLITLLWTLLLIGDPLTLIIGILPMVMTEFLLAWKKQTGWKSFIFSSISILIGIIFSKIFLFIMRNGYGFSPGWAVQSDFIPLNRIPDHFLDVARSLLDINGANIFGHSYVVVDTWVRFSKLFFLVITLSLAIQVIHGFFKKTDKKYNFTLYFCSFVVLLNLMSVFFSQAADDAAGVHRYLLPLRIFGTLLLANWLPEYLSTIKKTDRIAYSLLAFATGFLIFGTSLESIIGWWMQIKSSKVVYITNPFEGNPLESEQKKIASWLVERKLLLGYSQYWNAQILTVLTNGKVRVLPVEYSEGHVKAKITFVSSRPYKQFSKTKPAFFVIGPNGEAGITLEHLTLVFLKPNHVKKIGHFLIAVWDNGVKVHMN